jgi:hypothetical protein
MTAGRRTPDYHKKVGQFTPTDFYNLHRRSLAPANLRAPFGRKCRNRIANRSIAIAQLPEGRNLCPEETSFFREESGPSTRLDIHM